MHLSFLNKSPTVNNKQMNHSWLPALDTDSIFFFLWLFWASITWFMDDWTKRPNKKYKYYFLYKYYVHMNHMNLRIDSWKAPDQSRQLSSTYTVNGRYFMTSKNIVYCSSTLRMR